MKKLTIILAHPDFSHSIANKTIIENLKKTYPNVNVRNIQELYPDFNIDVEAEQDNLIKSDIILFQFPVNWYNMPAILKQWFDKVLTHGFAYGHDGNKLKGKTVIASITAGGSRESYTPIGSNHFYLKQFFNNIENSGYFCGMNFDKYIVGYNNSYIPGIVNTPEQVIDRANAQSVKLIKELNTILE